jgi:hypothetical protein
MPIDNRQWYRAEHRAMRQAERRQTRRKQWLYRAAIGLLFAGVIALAAPLLGNVAVNMACSRGGVPLIIIQVGGGCP